MKVIYNSTFGGFHLSPKMVKMYEEKTGKQLDEYDDIYGNNYDLRADKDLIEIIENMSEEDRYWDSCTYISIQEVPDDYDWYIDEYDGSESVMLTWKESKIRNLCKEGKEDELIKYLNNVGSDAYCYYN